MPCIKLICCSLAAAALAFSMMVRCAFGALAWSSASTTVLSSGAAFLLEEMSDDGIGAFSSIVAEAMTGRDGEGENVKVEECDAIWGRDRMG